MAQVMEAPAATGGAQSSLSAGFARLMRQSDVLLAVAMAVDALNLMEARTITAVIVVDAADRVIGAVHMHDLLRAGVA